MKEELGKTKIDKKIDKKKIWVTQKLMNEL